MVRTDLESCLVVVEPIFNKNDQHKCNASLDNLTKYKDDLEKQYYSLLVFQVVGCFVGVIVTY